MIALLTFKLDKQIYALPVTNVVRIIEMVTIIDLPGAPKIIRGIINLRGKAVPVMDLRHRFGLPQQPFNLRTPIILADLVGDDRLLGLIVDTVEDVLNVTHEELELTETIVPVELKQQMAHEAPHLIGVAKVDRQIILILNIHALLSSTERVDLSQVLGSEATQPATPL
jgi:purine-binding chemotaxis protein CheW